MNNLVKPAERLKPASRTRMLFLNAHIEQLWREKNPLDEAFSLQGEVFRDVPGRRTMRVQLGSSAYFVKLHYGVGWPEIFKNWLQLKWPVLGATNEYEACAGLFDVGIRAPRLVAYGVSHGSMARRRSFIITQELAGFTSLEEITEAWHATAPTAKQRLAVLVAVAKFARAFHAQGYIHRDFYICHLLSDDAAMADGRVDLAVLDLHRARQFAEIPQRWLKRDLAALLFSSMDLDLSKREWLRFIRLYAGRPLRQELSEQAAFWQSVLHRAERLYDEGLRKGTVQGRYRT